MGKTCGNLGRAYHRLGRYADAILLHFEMVDASKRSKNRVGEGLAYEHLAADFFQMGDLGRGRFYGEKARQAAVEGKEASLGEEKWRYIYREGQACLILANCAFELGQYDLAEKLYEKYQKLNPKGSLDEARFLQGIGLIKGREGKLEEAIYCFKLSFDMAVGSVKEQACAYNNLGNCYRALGNFRQAIVFHQKALALLDTFENHYSYVKALNNLGKDYLEMGDFDNALHYFEQGLEAAKGGRDRIEEGVSYYEMGRLHFKRGELVTAKSFFKKTRNAYANQKESVEDHSSQITLAERQSEAYRALEETFIAEENYLGALEVVDFGRSQTLGELLRSKLGLDPQVKPTSLKEMRAYTRLRNTTAIVYSSSLLYPHRLYTWVVNPQGEVTFTSLDAAPLSLNKGLVTLEEDKGEEVGRYADRLNQHLETRGGKAAPPAGLDRIYDHLIRPLELAELIKEDPNHTLTFFPDSSLMRLPLAAAFDTLSKKYLIQKWNVALAPSFEVLSLLEEAASRKRGGRPCLVGDSKADLEWAPKEVRAIGHILNSSPYLQSDATFVSLFSAICKANLLHFAIHGNGTSHFNKSSPFLGYLKFYDRDWFAGEVVDFELNADLAFLSACKSGEGRQMHEGLIGLPRSFFGATVPSVIATHWSIRDEEAVFIGENFYRHYLGLSEESQQIGQPLTKGEALSWSMRRAAEEGKDPATWGAFFLIGLNDTAKRDGECCLISDAAHS